MNGPQQITIRHESNIVVQHNRHRWSLRRIAGLLIAIALILASCANPIPPGGGPRDTTPPSVVESRPSAGDVNIDQDVNVEIAFSEYIERGSFGQALSVTPVLDGQSPEIDHDGRSVTISFPEPLRDNTTYIITLDTNLRDVRGVELDAPITIAFSTGPTINRGTLSGRVLQADAGAPQEGIDIYAYALDAPGMPDSTALDTAAADSGSSVAPPRPVALPDSLPERPAYRTQTDSDGQFQFDYLSEQPYYVIALTDVNRNRQPDASEAFAVPPQPALLADSMGTSPPQPWVATLRDTTPPRPVRVQSSSRRRHAVRFDVAVELLDRTPSRWALLDSVREADVSVGAVYQRDSDRRLVHLRTSPLNATPHRLILPPRTVADSIGNVVPTDTLRFTPSGAADTLRTRFVQFTPAGLSPDTSDVYTLLPEESPGVRLNEPVDSTRLQSIITARDSMDTARAFTLSTRDGTTYHLHFTPPLAPTERVDVQVDGASLARPDTTFVRMFRRIANRQLGAVGGTVTLTTPSPDSTGGRPAPPDSAQANQAVIDTTQALPAPLVVEVLMEGVQPRVSPQQTETDSTGTFLFTRLPEGSYRFRAFLDVNRNGEWDGGQILPYQPAEPITWSEGTISNRPRWENILEAPLRLASPSER